jgi:hypothetical protein
LRARIPIQEDEGGEGSVHHGEILAHGAALAEAGKPKPLLNERRSDPKVAALVYIAAFAPDSGESVDALIKNPPPGAPAPPILPPQDGFLLLDRSKFAEAFAADVKPGLATFMADSQVPWGVKALSGTVTEPAWKSKPSWYMVTTEDRMIPAGAQRAMSKRADSKVTEVEGSHAVFISQPAAVASLIEQVANGSGPTVKYGIVVRPNLTM